MVKPLGIGLIGCGTVGSGVARLLLEQPDRLAARSGRALQLRRVVVRDENKARPVAIPENLISTDLRSILADPEIEVAVEVVGGVDWARQAVLDLLAAGKHVVTANKAMLAQHGDQVFATARKYKRTVAFEASVGGGIPIIGALAHGLSANQIYALQGILNGTSNFILTKMSEEGQTYKKALTEAQKLGYAELDPTFDVDGTDAAHKLAILAQIAFGITVPFEAIERRGIANLHQMDFRYGNDLGYTFKLLAEAWLNDRQLALHVSPVLVRRQAPLALIRGAYNAIQVFGDAVGDTLYCGQGAGQMPTASAVVADIVDLAVGRAQLTFQTLRLWCGETNGIRLRPTTTVPTRFYLRVLVEDHPGVLAEVATILARHKVSIASVIQPEAPDDHDGASVPLVIMTHTVATGSFQAAFAEIDRLTSVCSPGAYFPVAD
ncbi:MAG: homoserine dehydrogenase [Gemmataceae bacterium]